MGEIKLGFWPIRLRTRRTRDIAEPSDRTCLVLRYLAYEVYQSSMKAQVACSVCCISNKLSRHKKALSHNGTQRTAGLLLLEAHELSPLCGERWRVHVDFLLCFWSGKIERLTGGCSPRKNKNKNYIHSIKYLPQALRKSVYDIPAAAKKKSFKFHGGSFNKDSQYTARSGCKAVSKSLKMKEKSHVWTDPFPAMDIRGRHGIIHTRSYHAPRLSGQSPRRERDVAASSLPGNGDTCNAFCCFA